MPMIKKMRISVVVLVLWLLAGQVRAQVEDYYQEKRNRKKNPPLLSQLDLQRTNSNWYVGLEGGGKWNGTKLDNSISGVLQTQNYTNSYWAVQLGYEHNQCWAFETGYLRNPVSGYLFVVGQRTSRYLWRDWQTTIPLRFKWRLFKIGSVQKLSGLFMGAGVLVSPERGSGQRIGGFSLTGFSRLPNVVPPQFDTIQFINNTYLTGRGKVEWEANVEFVGRLSRRFELVAFVRATLANAPIFRSDTRLVINQKLQSNSTLQLNPFSYQFGMSFRYLYQSRNIYRSQYDQ